MNIIKNKKIYFSISIALVVLSIVGFFLKPIPKSIEFAGGSQALISGSSAPLDYLVVSDVVSGLDFVDSSLVQKQGDFVSIKTNTLNENQKGELLDAIASSYDGEVVLESFTTIGPSIGKELKTKSIYSLILVVIAIIIFIAYVFRKVSKPVSSWKYGVVAVITLLHDVIITSGFYVLLSMFSGAEINTLFVVALLTVLGVSVNDTIVVFDRIRENLLINEQNNFPKKFDEVVGVSIKETITRSISTSLTVVLVLLALVLFGPETTKVFSMTMMVGMIVGTFSSIFIASPLLVTLERIGRIKK